MPCTFILITPSILQGEMTVFRAVEGWLAARRKEMEEGGEENTEIHMERFTIQAVEHVR